MTLEDIIAMQNHRQCGSLRVCRIKCPSVDDSGLWGQCRRSAAVVPGICLKTAFKGLREAAKPTENLVESAEIPRENLDEIA